MKTISGSVISCLLAASVYSTMVAAQESQTDISKPAPVTENGITYISGGVGDVEAKEMKRAAKDYDLMLTFATREHGAYLSDVKIDIEDAKGNSVLSTVSDGPIFLADMPPGRYHIKAETEGKVVGTDVQITGRKRVGTTLVWPEKMVTSSPPAPSPESTISSDTSRTPESAAPTNTAPAENTAPTNEAPPAAPENLQSK